MDYEALSKNAVTFAEALSTWILTSLAVLVGVIFIYQGIKKQIDHARGANPHESVFGYIAINFATGAALIQLSFFISAIVQSLFGTDVEAPIEALMYMPEQVQGTKVLDAAMKAASVWVSVIGSISIFRGIVLWNSLAKGQQAIQGAGWKGFYHILFGGLAVNITGLLRLLFGD